MSSGNVNSAAAPPSPPAPLGWRAPAVALGFITVGTAAIAAWNPSDSGPVLCASRLVGIDCPFCGGLRCTSALARGNLLEAADHNVLLAIALPILGVWLVWWLVRELRGRGRPPQLIPRSGWMAVVVLFTVFTVVRNLPLGPVADWLAASA